METFATALGLVGLMTVGMVLVALAASGSLGMFVGL